MSFGSSSSTFQHSQPSTPPSSFSSLPSFNFSQLTSLFEGLRWLFENGFYYAQLIGTTGWLILLCFLCVVGLTLKCRSIGRSLFLNHLKKDTKKLLLENKIK
jgi:hypothetical protein